MAELGFVPVNAALRARMRTQIQVLILRHRAALTPSDAIFGARAQGVVVRDLLKSEKSPRP